MLSRFMGIGLIALIFHGSAFADDLIIAIRFVEVKGADAEAIRLINPIFPKDAKVLVSLSTRAKVGEAFSARAQVADMVVNLTGTTVKVDKDELLVEFSARRDSGDQSSEGAQLRIKLKVGDEICASGGSSFICISLTKP